MLLLACSALFLSSCIGAKNYKRYIEEEMLFPLSRMSEAYYDPNWSYGIDYEGAMEEVLTTLSLYIDGEEDITRGEAREAYRIIEEYIEAARKAAYKLHEDARDYVR